MIVETAFLFTILVLSTGYLLYYSLLIVEKTLDLLVE